jgi:indoleamine 2,3-dioxygenase
MPNAYQEYSISPLHGFLPDRPPMARLPRYYVAWDELAYNLPDIVTAGLIAGEVHRLPKISPDRMGSHLAYERAMMVLSFISHAYLNDPTEPRKMLPEALAVPWTQVAKRLDRPPVLSHASAVLHNWSVIDPDQPISLNNLAVLQRYRGGVDEAWFFLVTVTIEFQGAGLINNVLKCYETMANDPDQSLVQLDDIIQGLKDVTATLSRMTEQCDPHVFYHQTRPFLATLEGIVYQGVAEDPQRWLGGSAAQSSLIQMLDIAFGVEHSEDNSNAFIILMRQYMPLQHRLFLEYLESIPNLTSLARHEEQEGRISQIHQALLQFRDEHLKIFHRYIAAQAKKAGPGDTGTGGTDAGAFLKQVRKDTDLI